MDFKRKIRSGKKANRYRTRRPGLEHAPPQAGLRGEEERRSSQRLGDKLQVRGELRLRPPQLRRAAVGANVLGDRSIRRPAAHDRERNAEQHGDASTQGQRQAAGLHAAGREEQPGCCGRGVPGRVMELTTGGLWVFVQVRCSQLRFRMQLVTVYFSEY